MIIIDFFLYLFPVLFYTGESVMDVIYLTYLGCLTISLIASLIARKIVKDKNNEINLIALTLKSTGLHMIFKDECFYIIDEDINMFGKCSCCGSINTFMKKINIHEYDSVTVTKNATRPKHVNICPKCHCFLSLLTKEYEAFMNMNSFVRADEITKPFDYVSNKIKFYKFIFDEHHRTYVIRDKSFADILLGFVKKG